MKKKCTLVNWENNNMISINNYYRKSVKTTILQLSTYYLGTKNYCKLLIIYNA